MDVKNVTSHSNDRQEIEVVARDTRERRKKERKKERSGPPTGAHCINSLRSLPSLSVRVHNEGRRRAQVASKWSKRNTNRRRDDSGTKHQGKRGKDEEKH